LWDDDQETVNDIISAVLSVALTQTHGAYNTCSAYMTIGYI